MKAFVYIIFFCCTARLFAQTPSIDHLEVDETQSRLHIIGSFASASGSVAIEDTTLTVISWTDSPSSPNSPTQEKEPEDMSSSAI